jgi:hypothetical protein
MARLEPLPTKPSDCALAICIPTCFSEFHDSLEDGQDKDFARSILRSHPGVGLLRQWEVAAFELTPFLTLVDRIARCGVHVKTQATLADFGQLIKQFRVVTIVTHWRPAWVFPDQIKSTSLLLDALQHSAYEELKTVSTNCTKPVGDYDDQENEHICECLNKIIQDGYQSLPFGSVMHSMAAKELYCSFSNRTTLDNIAAGALIPGNMAEFFDGMKNYANMISLIPNDPAKIIDLNFCNAILLAELLKRERDVRVLASEDPIDLTLRSILYEGVIDIIATAPYDYADAMRDLRLELANQWREN